MATFGMACILLLADAVSAGIAPCAAKTTVNGNAGEDPIAIVRRTRSLEPGESFSKRQTMAKQTRIAVPPGSWAGDGIKLEIADASSSLQFVCADGMIAERLFRDRDGKFTATGSFLRRTPGPQREGGNASQKASFVGRITGHSMKIKIVLTETDEMVGEFTLELGKKVRLQRCL